MNSNIEKLGDVNGALKYIQISRSLAGALKIFGEAAEIATGITIDIEFVDELRAKDKETFDRAKQAVTCAVDASTPEGDFIFHPNGYTAFALESGIVAVHSALIHMKNSLVPDPVEEVHGEYANMCLQKVLREVLYVAHGRRCELSREEFSKRHFSKQWHQGHYSRSGMIAAVTGGLYTFGEEGQLDIRADLLADPCIGESVRASGCLPIDQLAGSADQYRAQFAVASYETRRKFGWTIPLENVKRRINEDIKYNKDTN